MHHECRAVEQCGDFSQADEMSEESGQLSKPDGIRYVYVAHVHNSDVGFVQT